MDRQLPQERFVPDERSRMIVPHVPHDNEPGTKAIDTITFGISEPRFINPGKDKPDQHMVAAVKKHGFADAKKWYRCSKNPSLIVLEE